MTDSITTELAQELRERYTPKPAPKCHICGSKMTIQRSGGGSLTYGCDGRVDTGAEGYQFSEGRSFADDHYAQSRVTMAARGDDDVIALLDSLEAKDKQIAELEKKHCGTALMEREEAHAVTVGKLIDRIAELEARTEQQPVAYMHHSGQVITREECCDDEVFAICCKVEKPLYASAPAAQPVTVKLRKFSVGEVMHMTGFSRDYAEGWCAGNDNAMHEVRVAGIKIAEGE